MMRLSWVVGAVHRILQGCYGDDHGDIVLSILELMLELEVSGLWTGLLGIAMTKVEQPIVMRGTELQQKVRLLCEVRVALKLHPQRTP